MRTAGRRRPIEGSRPEFDSTSLVCDNDKTTRFVG